MRRHYNGDEALALGAITAGVDMATGYPGTPGTGVLQALIDQATASDMYVEWSTNERVALEMAIGASMAGSRALVCTKSVGMNVMLDPLMCLNLTGVHGGLVILLGDDPGAYGSQNDQDTRNLTSMLEIPMFEPASIVEGYSMICSAFDLSERFNTALIIRVTRSYMQQVEEIIPAADIPPRAALKMARDAYRFVPYPGNAVEMHRKLHERLGVIEAWADKSTYNEMIGSGPMGIVAAGFVYQKLIDVLGDVRQDELRILKLSCLYPFPRGLINRFLEGCDQVLVLEEVDPYVENQLKATAFDLGYREKILGKVSGDVNWEGELYRWQIEEALARYIPALIPGHSYLVENEALERPTKADHCAKYAYEEILNHFLRAADTLGQRPIIIADPGCMVKVADQLDAKFAIGSAVALASGVNKSRKDEKVIAFIGDSAFFHSTLPAICNTAYNQSDVLIVVLDNRGAASTGLQPTPGVGVDVFGNPAPKLDIPEIARACGVNFLQQVDAEASEAEIRLAIESGFGTKGLAMLIFRIKPTQHR
ncbi:MAG: hypothetical protein IZT55_04545 [Anaerolineae bacterium]|nr:hypothetical protein [Anaerolineae bacterium]